MDIIKLLTDQYNKEKRMYNKLSWKQKAEYWEADAHRLFKFICEKKLDAEYTQKELRENYPQFYKKKEND